MLLILHSSQDSKQDGAITNASEVNILKYCTPFLSGVNYVEIDGECDNFEVNGDCCENQHSRCDSEEDRYRIG